MAKLSLKSSAEPLPGDPLRRATTSETIKPLSFLWTDCGRKPPFSVGLTRRYSVINADSIQVYKGLISGRRRRPEEREAIEHHHRHRGWINPSVGDFIKPPMKRSL